MASLDSTTVVSGEAGESRRGWLVVIGAMLGVAVGLSPVPFYTIGMFAPVLSDTFGWSFASMMAALTIQSGVSVVTAPLAGMLVDRYGARPVAMISLALFGLCYASLGFTPGSIWVFYAQWVVMAIAGAGTLSGTWTCVVNGWFNRNRGLALGLASTGTGLTGIILKPLTAWLILSFGWQVAFVVIGMIPIFVGLPIVALLFREPSKQNTADISDQPERVQLLDGMTVREAFASRQFWIMGVAFLLIAFALTAPTPNLENILKSLNFDLTTVGQIAAVFGLAVITGRIVGGWLLDRLWAPLCAFLLFLLPAVGNFVLAQPIVDQGHAWWAVAAIGLAAGFEFDLLAYLVNRYFGQRSYATIYGYFFAAVVIGGGLGPVAYGYAFDTTGTYSMVLKIGAVVLVCGSALLLLMGPYPKRFGAGDKGEPAPE